MQAYGQLFYFDKHGLQWGLHVKHILNFINACGELRWKFTNIYVVNCESFAVKPRPQSEPPSPPMDTGQRLDPKFNYLETEIIYAGEIFSSFFLTRSLWFINMLYHPGHTVLPENEFRLIMKTVAIHMKSIFMYEKIFCHSGKNLFTQVQPNGHA